ncbi:MAG: thermostable hemolysin [Burkholderiaceae bacterium]
MPHPERDCGGQGSVAPVSGRYEIHEHAVHERDVVQDFVRHCFRQSFGSDVRGFMPRLFSLREGGQLCGAFGLRSGRESFFLERYLDRPIEHWPARHGLTPWHRHRIVEVGHLSANFAGGARTLIRLLTLQLQREGIEGIAFTGTTSLRNAFRRMGLAPVALGAASADRLAEHERPAWGSYYGHAPQVYIGDVSGGYRTLTGTRTPAW